MALGEFLKEIKKNPSSVKFAEMANILVIHCQASGECAKPSVLDGAWVAATVPVTVTKTFDSGLKSVVCVDGTVLLYSSPAPPRKQATIPAPTQHLRWIMVHSWLNQHQALDRVVFSKGG